MPRGNFVYWEEEATTTPYTLKCTGRVLLELFDVLKCPVSPSSLQFGKVVTHILALLLQLEYKHKMLQFKSYGLINYHYMLHQSADHVTV